MNALGLGSRVPLRDLVLIYLGISDLGPVDKQFLFTRAAPNGPGVVLSGKLMTN